MEKLEDLQLNGLKIYQRTDLYRFTSDAVILANFADVRKNDFVVDFGTGSAIIPLLLAGTKQFKKICGVEIQRELFQMAKKSIEYNNLDGKIELVRGKIQKVHKQLVKHPDVVVCNPPYRKLGEGESSKNKSFEIAKFEVEIDLANIIESARRNLKVGGRFYMIHRSDRLMEIIALLSRNDIKLRKIRFVHSKSQNPAHLVLIEGISGGKCQVKVLPPLILKNEDGSDSLEINKIYHREED